MAFKLFTYLVLLLGCVCAAPAGQTLEDTKAAGPHVLLQEKDDLKTDESSSHSRRSAWGSYPSTYNSGYGVTGYGFIDDRYSNSYRGSGGYDNTLGYGGYNSYSGYNNYPGYGGYSGTAGYSGYNKNFGGHGGYGGYGGYGGNGGLDSYYGYNNPAYPSSYHLGHGYYNAKPGYGNIYSSGITPNLVTGYRGYSRR